MSLVPALPQHPPLSSNPPKRATPRTVKTPFLSLSQRLCVSASKSTRAFSANLRDLRVSAVNSLFLLLLTLTISPPLSAAVIDRVAVVVGNTVITETEVLQEARLEAFLNQAPLDLSAQQRRTAAER